MGTSRKILMWQLLLVLSSLFVPGAICIGAGTTPHNPLHHTMRLTVRNRTDNHLKLEYRWEGQRSWTILVESLAPNSDSPRKTLAIGGDGKVKEAHLYLRAGSPGWNGYAKHDFKAERGTHYTWTVSED